MNSELSSREYHQLLKEKISGLPQVDAVTIIDAAGNLVNFSRYWPIPDVNISDRDYFKALKDDASLDRAIGEPVQNRGTGTWTIYNARKIRMQDGSFGGMVLVAVELSYFERFFQSIATGDGRAINLFRADGTLLARFPRVPHSVGKQMSNSQLFGALLLRENSGVVKQRSNIDGFERLIAAKKVVGFPLVVTVADTVDAALSRWRSDAKAIALLTCLLEILIFSSFFMWRRQYVAKQSADEAHRTAGRT